MISPRLRAAVIASADAIAVSPGAMPAYASATAAPTASATLNVTHSVDYPAAVTAGDKIFLAAWCRAVTSPTITLHADAISAGFTELQNFGSNRTVFLAVKNGVGDEDGTTLTNALTSAGSGGSECFHASMFRFTAANGFHPSSPIIGTVTASGTSTTLPAPSLTPTDVNQLGVCFVYLGTHGVAAGVDAFTGQSGGTGAWAEAVEQSTQVGTDNTIQVQTIDLSGGAGDAVSGGSDTLLISTLYRTIAFILVPANT